MKLHNFKGKTWVEESDHKKALAQAEKRGYEKGISESKLSRAWLDVDKTIAKARQEEREKIHCKLYKLNWIEILGAAIDGRRSSWGDKPVIEWRNASDELLTALIRAMTAEGLVEDVWGMDRLKKLKETK